MPSGIFRDAAVWMDGHDVTGRINSVALNTGAELQDATVLGDKARRRRAGLHLVTVNVEGLYDADAAEKALFDNLGIANVPITIGPVDNVEGSLCYSFSAVEGEYQIGGQIGEMHRFSMAAESDQDDLIRGTLMKNGTETATGTGTARQLGAVGATQKVYAALHVLAASGTTPTLDVTIESDDLVGFASSTTRITFAQANAVGSEWGPPKAGALTDDFWRVAWTIGGGTPSFTFVVFLGIQ